MFPPQLFPSFSACLISSSLSFLATLTQGTHPWTFNNDYRPSARGATACSVLQHLLSAVCVNCTVRGGCLNNIGGTLCHGIFGWLLGLVDLAWYVQ